MAERIGLGIDAGGVATRWVIAAAGRGVLARGEGQPFNGHVFSDAAREAARDALLAMGAAAKDAPRPQHAVAGITGLPRGSAEKPFFSRAIGAAFGLDPARVSIRGDLDIAYRGVFAPGEGILVYAGTGAIGFHLDSADGEHRAGGYGAILDDAGSAYWIAVQGLRAVLRREDAAPGAGWATLLGHALAAAIGARDWPSVRAFAYSADRGQLGLLAPAVGEAARQGDADALAILAAAGHELARLAAALRARLGPLPVALGGGAVRVHTAIAATFHAEVAGSRRMPDIDAAATAARLAAGEG